MCAERNAKHSHDRIMQIKAFVYTDRPVFTIVASHPAIHQENMYV